MAYVSVTYGVFSYYLQSIFLPVGHGNDSSHCRFSAVSSGTDRQPEGVTPENLLQKLLVLGSNWEVAESRFDQASGTVYLEIGETARLREHTRCRPERRSGFC